MILIGSKAIRHHFPDFTRHPSDSDYSVRKKNAKSVMLSKEREDGTVDDERWEFLYIPPINKRYKHDMSIVSPDHLYTLKMSHIFWPIKQEKHLYDISFMRKKGCKLNMPLFEELFKHWTRVHGPNTRLNFKKDNNDFFDDAVERKHPHDDLHLMMNPEPLYIRAKINPDEADISEEVFMTLPKDVQMNIVREEGYVLALERILIPGHDVHWRTAYARMLRAMICRLTPRWLGVFIVENYYELLKPEYNFHKKYKEIQSKTE